MLEAQASSFRSLQRMPQSQGSKKSLNSLHSALTAAYKELRASWEGLIEVILTYSLYHLTLNESMEQKRSCIKSYIGFLSLILGMCILCTYFLMNLWRCATNSSTIWWCREELLCRL
ncbi:hypothetical protein GGP41_008639 [Bipolaris sorokiniana]|uniref:Uncharacterized protein n=1 Tax=Cochliobolus sativus TaxID=45130 RepID=A0A8H5Z9G7_COCSA|nr:hypothetical protein GGP41_008639 [Bipolaris sorokiniana]